MIATRKPGDRDQPRRPPRGSADAPISPRTRLFLWLFSITLVLTAGTAFVFKLIEFLYQFTASDNAVAGESGMPRPGLIFTTAPVLVYLIVAAGFSCLFIWAYLSGQFRNVEAPKHRMLELQRLIDRAEADTGQAKGGRHV